MKLCKNCYFCEAHCQCSYPQWKDKVNYCCEKCEAADSRIAELKAQLAAAQAEITRLWQIAYNGEYSKARNWGADHEQADTYALRVAGEKK